MTGSGERTFSPSPRKFPALLPGSPKRTQARVKLLLQRVRFPPDELPTGGRKSKSTVVATLAVTTAGLMRLCGYAFADAFE